MLTMNYFMVSTAMVNEAPFGKAELGTYRAIIPKRLNMFGFNMFPKPRSVFNGP